MASKVIVIGGGLAGLSATIEAINSGSNVLLLEKAPRLGGNSSMASSGINGVNSSAQSAAQSKDSKQAFTKDTLNSGDNLNAGELVDKLVNNSSSAIEFLSNFGIDLTNLSQCGAHSFARTHRAGPRTDGRLENIGRTIMSKLTEEVEKLPKEKVRIIPNAHVQRILRDDEDNVVGVSYETEVEGSKHIVDTIGDSVILATGGYCASQSLLKEFASEQIQKLATTNGLTAMGEGVEMARELNADLVHMQHVQVHPTGIVNPSDPCNLKKFLAPEAMRACGGILINSEGKRFCNELGRRDYVTEKIFQNCSEMVVDKEKVDENSKIPIVAFLMMNDEVAKKFDEKLFGFYKSKGMIVEFKDPEEFAKSLGTNASAAESLRNVLKAYNDCFDSSENKDEFGKTVFPVKFNLDQPLYVCITTPCTHYSMGGVKINVDCEVLSKSGKKINGLFAAGEVSGGVHGKNRLAGNSLLECVVFGRSAGKNASTFSKSVSVAGKKTFVDAAGVTHNSALTADKFTRLELSERFQLNPTTHVLRFALPSPTDQIGLLVGQYIAVRAIIDDKEVIRYYSPISLNRDFGKLELLIKIEEPKPGKPVGGMASYLKNLEPGTEMEIKGPLGGFQYHRNAYNKIGMIAGGTGISPMMQIIRSVLSHPEDKTALSLLYGNFVEDDILCRDELMYYSYTRKGIDSYFTLVEPPSRWDQGKGFITEEMIKERMPPPHKDTKIILCGPPPMIKVMKEYLHNLGYSQDNYFSFI